MDKRISMTVNCFNDKCPLPFVKTRSALFNARKGDIIKIIGQDKKSYYEILMALEVWNVRLIYKNLEISKWEILFEVDKSDF